MKKLLSFILVIILAGVATPVFAQGGTTESDAPGTWKSTISIFNSNPETPASVTLDFFEPSGVTIVHTEGPLSISPGETLYLYSPANFAGLGSGQYSVVVSSSVPVTVVASQRSTSPRSGGAYTGISSDETSTDLFFPGLYKDYYTFNSELILQNTSSTEADVTVNFFLQSTGASAGAPLVDTIPPMGSMVFSLQDLPSVPSGKINGLISAHVESSQPIVGVGDIWSPRVNGIFSNYNPFINGTTDELFMPALYKYYYNFVSALTVQNIDEVENADIKVTYSNGTTRTATLSPNQSIEYFQPNDPNLPSGKTSGVFSAKVESLNNVPIVAFVTVEDIRKGLLGSYNAAVNATTQVNCSLIYQDYFDWFNATTVQNVGTAPTDITIKYSVGNPGEYDRTFTNVPPNGTINIIELPHAGSKLPDGTVASAIVESSGEPIIAVVQMNNEVVYPSKPGDYLEAYTCIPVTSP